MAEAGGGRPGRDEEAGGLPTSVRRARILETIRRHEFASVTDLSARYGVSEVTIRSDLEALAEGGQIRRVRGGAVHRTTVAGEPSFEQSADAFAAEKERIGRHNAYRVHPELAFRHPLESGRPVADLLRIFDE